MGAINYLELDSNTNISVVTATEIGSYTATDYRLVFARLYAQDLAGSGDYIYYATLTPSGLSEAIIGTKTTQTLAAGETKLSGMSVPMILNAGDVFKVYLDGLAGDNTNAVDTRVWFYDANDPAVAVLDAVAADFDDPNTIGAKINDISTVAEISDGVWDELLAGHVVAGSASVALSAAGSASDPLLNAVPGTYLAGSAGAALGRIGSGLISTTSPVAQDGTVETHRGDDYLAADARRIDWTDVSANWPVLTAATILVVVGGDTSFAGSVITATGTGKKVGVELTATQSQTIPQGILDFVVRATLSTGHVVTLVSGKWTSKKQLVVGS